MDSVAVDPRILAAAAFIAPQKAHDIADCRRAAGRRVRMYICSRIERERW
jgi:hypothetical protein